MGVIYRLTLQEFSRFRNDNRSHVDDQLKQIKPFPYRTWEEITCWSDQVQYCALSCLENWSASKCVVNCHTLKLFGAAMRLAVSANWSRQSVDSETPMCRRDKSNLDNNIKTEHRSVCPKRSNSSWRSDIVFYSVRGLPGKIWSQYNSSSSASLYKKPWPSASCAVSLFYIAVLSRSHLLVEDLLFPAWFVFKTIFFVPLLRR